MTAIRKKLQVVVAEWNIKRVAGIALLELVLMLSIAIAALRLWRIDFSVPFNYGGDTLWFVVLVKGMIENGWTYEIPQLSAPFTLSAAAFPAMTNLDWLIMKAISLSASDAGTVLNAFWLFSILLTAWSATLALHLLGVRSWPALGIGIVYAFLPFGLMRSVGHIVLVYYCVPLLALLAIYIARGCEHPHSPTVRLVGYGAVLAQGFDYIYFSFFAVLLFAFAGCLGFMQKRSWKPLREAALASAVIIVAASLNLMPSFLSWHTHGKPPNVSYKLAEEAEIYGLKIRRMLAPHEANRVPIFSQWGRRDMSISFPNENENRTARLGPMAAAGLLLLLAMSSGLVGHRNAHEVDEIRPIASLALFSVLFTTVGGFGALVSQVLPDIRGYNRFSVFIAFLALAAVALWWQARMRVATTRCHKRMLATGLIVLMVFSLYDQLLDAGHLNNRRPADQMSAMREREVVKQIEINVPTGTSLFQLPVTGFPPDGGKERMLPYDHARPYLWSSHLRWSWPSFSWRHRYWLDQLDGLEGAALAEALVLSKFRLIWVDRFGYQDNGDRVVSALIASGAKAMLPGMSPRYVVLDLTQVAERLQRQLGVAEFARRQAALLDAHRGRTSMPTRILQAVVIPDHPLELPLAGQISVSLISPALRGFGLVEGPYPQWKMDRPVRWMEGREAEIRFRSDRGRAPFILTISVRSLVADQKLEVFLNGAPLVDHPFSRVNEWETVVSREITLAPENRLTFRAARSVSEGGRELAVLFDEIALEQKWRFRLPRG